MKPLIDTDTVASIATARRVEAEEARIARIRGSKTNMEYLMNAGVIITCDDEMDNYYHDMYIAKRAAEAGTTIAEAEEAFAQERAEENVRSALKWDVSMNETMAENVARRDALMATAVGTMESGRKCKHNRTKKELGWINREGFHCMTARDDDGNWPFKCCRCGAEVTLIALTEPTEQAKLAATILAK